MTQPTFGELFVRYMEQPKRNYGPTVEQQVPAYVATMDKMAELERTQESVNFNGLKALSVSCMTKREKDALRHTLYLVAKRALQ